MYATGVAIGRVIMTVARAAPVSLGVDTFTGQIRFHLKLPEARRNSSIPPVTSELADRR